MSEDCQNFFESLRSLVQRHMPERLAAFDAQAHRLRAHKNDEIFALIDAAALSSILAGREVRAANAEAGEALAAAIATLRADLAQTREAPRLVANSVEALHIKTAGIEKAAKELSDISASVVVIFALGGMVLGGILTVAAGKFFNLL